VEEEEEEEPEEPIFSKSAPNEIEISMKEMQSVGRLYLNLSKVVYPKRWKSLQSPSDNNLKKSNT